MRKLQDIKYIIKLTEAKPDSNSAIRFVTQYLSFIQGSIKVQTTDGVIHLIQNYAGPQLRHNDTIIFTGKLLGGDFLQGTIKPISKQEYAILLKNRGQFLKQKPSTTNVHSPIDPKDNHF